MAVKLRTSVGSIWVKVLTGHLWEGERERGWAEGGIEGGRRAEQMGWRWMKTKIRSMGEGGRDRKIRGGREIERLGGRETERLGRWKEGRDIHGRREDSYRAGEEGKGEFNYACT